MQAILALLKPFWVPIAKIGGLAIAGLLFWLQARKSGEATIKQQNLENTFKGVQERDKTENDISKLSDDKLDKLYQDHIKRD